MDRPEQFNVCAPPATSSPSNTSKPTFSKGSSIGAVIGGAVGGGVVLIAVVGLIVFLCRRNRRSKKQADLNSAPTTSTPKTKCKAQNRLSALSGNTRKPLALGALWFLLTFSQHHQPMMLRIPVKPRRSMRSRRLTTAIGMTHKARRSYQQRCHPRRTHKDTRNFQQMYQRKDSLSCQLMPLTRRQRLVLLRSRRDRYRLSLRRILGADGTGELMLEVECRHKGRF